tara:strand:+ start:118 stop:342 length:225 start_codon:yes stop_codon:yes gene_type:complete
VQLPDDASAHLAAAYGEAFKTAESDRETRLKVRCGNCGKLLAELVTAPWRIACPRCKIANESAPIRNKAVIKNN